MPASDWEVVQEGTPAATGSQSDQSLLSAAGELYRNISPYNAVRAPLNIARQVWNNPRGSLQTADDAVRAAANAATFGMADRLAGYMGGQGTDAEVQRSEAARARSPAASIAGDVAGSVALPGFGAEALAARYGGGLLARAGAYGATGAGVGAAQGAGTTYTGNPTDYLRNAAIGASLGGVTGGIGGAAFGARAPRSLAAVPDVAEQQAFKNAAYDALKSNPVRYDAAALAQRAAEQENRFATVPAERFFRRDSPGAFRGLDEMRAPQAAATRAGPGTTADVGLADLDFMVQGINKIPRTAERQRDVEAGRYVKRALNDFVENPPPGAVLPGHATNARDAAAQALLARESNAAYKRAQRADAMRQNAEGRAQSNYSGLNLENELRKEYRDLLKINKETGRSGAQNAGYSPAEIERFRQFREGTDTRGRNALRWAAKTAGGGSGLGALTAAIAGGVAGGAGATAAYANDDPRWLSMLAIPAAGLGLRSAGNRLALRNVNQLDEMVRMNSPLYRQRAAQAGTVQGGSPGTAQSVRDAVTLELLKQLQGRGGSAGSASDWQ